MRWSSSASSGVRIPELLVSDSPVGAPLQLLLLHSRGAFWSRNSSCAPAGIADAADCRGRFLRCSCPRIWRGARSMRLTSLSQLATPPRCSRNGDAEVGHVEDAVKLSNEATGSKEGDGKGAVKRSFSSEELKVRLKRYGIAGVLSYGLLNTFYYLVTFLSVWFYFLPAPGKMGYAAAVERFIKVMAAVWAGSQVTKLLRAGGKAWALALAPLVDKGLSWFTVNFNLKSKGKAFAVIAGACFGLAFILFLTLTLLWA